MHERTISRVMAELGRRSRAQLTPGQRSASARKAAFAMWERKRAKESAHRSRVQNLENCDVKQDTLQAVSEQTDANG